MHRQIYSESFVFHLVFTSTLQSMKLTVNVLGMCSANKSHYYRDDNLVIWKRRCQSGNHLQRMGAVSKHQTLRKGKAVSPRCRSTDPGLLSKTLFTHHTIQISSVSDELCTREVGRQDTTTPYGHSRWRETSVTNMKSGPYSWFQDLKP